MHVFDLGFNLSGALLIKFSVNVSASHLRILNYDTPVVRLFFNLPPSKCLIRHSAEDKNVGIYITYYARLIYQHFAFTFML